MVNIMIANQPLATLVTWQARLNVEVNVLKVNVPHQIKETGNIIRRVVSFVAHNGIHHILLR